jgi:hypothetical protein
MQRSSWRFLAHKDGEVNVSGLVKVILEWGSCGGCNGCMGDVDDDSQVAVTDLVQVILHWGPCEEQMAPALFYDCVDRCGATDPNCIVDCAEFFDLLD